MLKQIQERRHPAIKQKWRNNEVDGRLFWNSKCQKTRAHYQHYVKKSLHALCDITRQAVRLSFTWEDKRRAFVDMQRVRKYAISIIPLGKIF